MLQKISSYIINRIIDIYYYIIICPICYKYNPELEKIIKYIFDNNEINYIDYSNYYIRIIFKSNLCLEMWIANRYYGYFSTGNITMGTDHLIGHPHMSNNIIMEWDKCRLSARYTWYIINKFNLRKKPDTIKKYNNKYLNQIL